MNTEAWPAEWMRGLLTLCVLKVLSAGATYGYAISAALADAELGPVKGGTLYPLLSRLEAADLVTVRWESAEGRPGRKYFALTDKGRAEFDRQSAAWDVFANRISTHLRADQG